jgi:threonine/homoserine/homoserine lactone efflux protein
MDLAPPARLTPSLDDAEEALMPELSTLALFALAALALLIVPGPAVIYIVTRSVDQGRAAGFASVLGVHIGTLFHIAAAALGLSALLASSALAFDAVKYVGAGYLVYLGIRKLLERDGTQAVGRARRQPLGRIFADGVVVNVLNPKTALFFFAFLPQFVDVARGAVAQQIVVLGATFILLGLCSDGAYSLLAARAGNLLRDNPTFARAQRLFSGCVYLSLGAAAALAGPKAASK